MQAHRPDPHNESAITKLLVQLRGVNLFTNPLVVRGVRTRLRLQAALSAGLITVTIAGFLYTMAYISTVNNTTMPDNATAADQAQLVRLAAKTAMVPLIIMQGIILMVLGTGAAAGGIARERSDRLLDYHRVTPLPPHAKILGLLFGLPIREYFMFALTLPFVAYAAHKGGVPGTALLQFYIVFLTSVWLYHLTGMVSGMIVDRPWRAGFMVQGLVIGLYVFLPQLGAFGLTSFEFLTARPAFYGIVQEHLLTDMSEIGSFSEGWEQTQLRLASLRWQEVAFFNIKLDPLTFSLMVQGFVLTVLYTVIHRKWLGEARLPLSKPTGLVFFALLQVFALGSLLGLLRDTAAFADMVENQRNIANAVSRGERWVVWRFAFAALAVSGVAGTILLHLVTPTWHQQVSALRKSRQRGRPRLPLLADAASPCPVALGVVVMSAAAYLLLVQQIDQLDRLNRGPYWDAALGGAVFIALALSAVFFVREIVGAKPFIMVVFVAWVVPFLAFLIVFFGLKQEAMGVFIALPCPVSEVYLYTVLLVHDPATGVKEFVMMPEEVAPLAGAMSKLGTAGYLVALLGLGVLWGLRRRRLLRAVGSGPAVSAPIAAHPRSPRLQAAD